MPIWCSAAKMPSVFQRQRSVGQVVPDLQGKVDHIAGFQSAVIPPPSLPGSGGGLPMQFVITSDADYAKLDQLADQVLDKAMQSGQFAF